MDQVYFTCWIQLTVLKAAYYHQRLSSSLKTAFMDFETYQICANWFFVLVLYSYFFSLSGYVR